MFLDRCRLLGEALNKPAITTDIIVGFPGETEDEFRQTLDTCRAAGFSKIHAFPFSARRGTPAAEMPDQLPGDLKSDRDRQLGELETELRGGYFRSLVGESVQVLIESERTLATIGSGGPAERLLRGTTCRYAPAEWVSDSDRHVTGDLVNAIVVDADDERVLVKEA